MSSDLRQMLAEHQPITRTIGGKDYQFRRAIPARIGLLLIDMMNGTHNADEFFTADENINLRHELIGADVLRQLVLDGCTGEEVERVLSFLVTWHTNGPTAAEKMWDSWGDAPGGSQPAASAGPQQPQQGAAEAPKTPTPASTSGTRTSTSKSKRKPARS